MVAILTLLCLLGVEAAPAGAKPGSGSNAGAHHGHHGK